MSKAQKKADDLRGRLFFPMLLVSLAMGYSFLQLPPNETELRYATGRVASANWKRGDHDQFITRVADYSQVFQTKLPKDLPAPIDEYVAADKNIRIGHTDDTIGMFGLNENIRIYSLEVDGTVLYTLAEVHAHERAEKKKELAVCLVCGSFAYLSFRRLRRRMRGEPLKNDGQASAEQERQPMHNSR